MIEELLYFEIVILGGTPGGLATAITAARLGRKVAVIEPHNHIGGMTTSGLGKSDVEQKDLIGGLFREFTGRVYQYYQSKFLPDSKDLKLCREGYYFEPSVAEMILNEMISETGNISVFTGHHLDKVSVENNCVWSIQSLDKTDGSCHIFSAELFIDATYEGDLYAAAGADYRLGREGRNE